LRGRFSEDRDLFFFNRHSLPGGRSERFRTDPPGSTVLLIHPRGGCVEAIF